MPEHICFGSLSSLDLLAVNSTIDTIFYPTASGPCKQTLHDYCCCKDILLQLMTQMEAAPCLYIDSNELSLSCLLAQPISARNSFRIGTGVIAQGCYVLGDRTGEKYEIQLFRPGVIESHCIMKQYG